MVGSSKGSLSSKEFHKIPKILASLNVCNSTGTSRLIAIESRHVETELKHAPIHRDVASIHIKNAGGVSCENMATSPKLFSRLLVRISLKRNSYFKHTLFTKIILKEHKPQILAKSWNKVRTNPS